MMFRRRSKKDSTNDLFVDDSSSNRSKNRIGNMSRHNKKYDLNMSLPELRRSLSLSAAPKPIRGILRITSVQDSLHTVYGSGISPRRAHSLLDFDASFRSSQSDDVYIRGTRQQRNSVLFKAIEIREYERTVGDNPSCSSGPPVSISWEYYPQAQSVSLDDYERCRSNRRASYEMILSREIRDSMLRKEWDISRAEIAAAIRDTVKVKNQRRQTVLNLNKDKVEELFEGASKKIFRSLMFKSSSAQELDLLNQQYNAVQELRQQEEMKVAQEQLHQHQQFRHSALNATNVSDSLMIVGMNIEDDTIVDDYDEEDDDDVEEDEQKQKQDMPAATSSTKTSTTKPILIVEEDDYDESMFTDRPTLPVDSDIIPPIVSPPPSSSLLPQHAVQCKGETSSEDGSHNLNNSHHKAIHHVVVATAATTTSTSNQMQQQQQQQQQITCTPMMTIGTEI